jgi:hypothetical protein
LTRIKLGAPLYPAGINGSGKTLQEQARAASGHWDREKHVWFVHYGCIAGAKLEKFRRIKGGNP